ncbi:MAG TPA: GntR family transcriptional regulator [Bryobacteraceae bacterium]
MRPHTSRTEMNLNEAVYEQIRDSILDGTFPLGAPLTRRRLGELFQMSPLPVAQALQRLEAEGLVESLPRVGTRVKVPKPEDVRGHYMLREALEAQAARLFAKNATKAQRRYVRWEAAKLDKQFAKYFSVPADTGRPVDVHRAHMRFHHELAALSQCEVLARHLRISQVLHLNWRYTLMNPQPLPANWHEQLVDVLCDGSEEEADRAMRRHVTYRMEEVIHECESFLANPELAAVGFRGPQRKTLERAVPPRRR